MFINFRQKTKEEKAQIKAKRSQERMINLSKSKLIDDWVESMAHKGIYNQKYETFILDNILYHSFGFSCNIRPRSGLSFTSLESNEVRDMIQANTGYRFNMTCIDNKPDIRRCVFLKDTISLEDYAEEKLEPYELYLGKDVYGNKLISNQIKFPNSFVQGAVNMGKTKLIDIILLNLLYNDNTRQCSMVDLYILQCDKFDQAVYKNTTQCKAYADTLEQQAILCAYVYDLVLQTNKKIKPYVSRYDEKKADNFHEFNSLIEKGIIKEEPIKCSYIVIDEYAGIMPDRETDPHKKKLKEQMQNNITEIIRLGRSAGIFCILSTQRGTVDMLPPLVKAMCNTMVSFRVNNQASEQVAGFDGLIELHPREYKCRIDKEYMASTLTVKQEHYTIIDKCKGNSKIDLSIYEHLLPEDKKKQEPKLEDKLVNPPAKKEQPKPKENATTDKQQPKPKLIQDAAPVPEPIVIERDANDIIGNSKPKKNKPQSFDKVNKPKTGTGYDPNWKPLLDTSKGDVNNGSQVNTKG